MGAGGLLSPPPRPVTGSSKKPGLNRVKNTTWQEVNQLAIYKSGYTRLEPGTSGYQSKEQKFQILRGTI